MAQYYNLAKVYARSENEQNEVLDVISFFVNEIPLLLNQMKEGIEEKHYEIVFINAGKIKPSLDLLGMETTFEEILQIEEWTKVKGKRKEIKETYKSIANEIEKAIKEIKKNFNLIAKHA